MTQQLSTFGIGASEIAAVCGLHEFSSPWDVYRKKIGEAPDVDTERMEWGLRLEPAIRQKYADDTGAALYVPSVSLFHPATKWARATPDAIVLESEEPLAKWVHLVQAKNVDTWVARSWRDAPPVYVQLQEQWELYVTDLSRADVAALIGGNDYRVYTVHRDQKLINDLVTVAEDFWRRVERREPPKVDESTACRDHFTSRLVGAPQVELLADAELELTIAEWYSARLAQKKAAKDIERHRNTVLSVLQSAQADRIVSPHGTPKLARHEEREHTETNWQLVAQLLAHAPNPGEVYAEIVAANTTTIKTPATVTLREPHQWSKEKP